MMILQSKKRYLKEKSSPEWETTKKKVTHTTTKWETSVFHLIQNQEPSMNHSFLLLISIQKGIMLTCE